MWLKVLLASAIFVLGVIAGPQHFDGQVEEILPLAPTDPPGYSFRLPNNSIPLNYDVLISTGIHIPDFTFTGRVLIRFRTLEASSNITINFKQLTIREVHLFDGNHIQVENFVNFELNNFTELMVIRPSILLPANTEFVLRVDYTGVMRTDSYGYYRGAYIDENGNQRWFGATQFQATDARHAFPCYDEPQFRTSFTIQIRNHQSYHALGNRPIVSISPPDAEGYRTTTFQQIPSMHTYLVAFTVSDFIFIENSTVVPPQRVYGRRQRILHGDGDFALEVSPAIMKVCEEYYGMPYTFPKMDQVALTTFPAGAMENWGLVNYLEIFLLFDPLISTTLNRDNIIRIIAHEFMHQWFGNIINPQWWTYLWVNEGFATLDQFYISHLTFPEDRYMDTFMATQVQPVFITDANPNIRHMSWYVESPAAILSLFDSISYPKAGGVLHTFMHAYGIPTWKKGIQYLIVDRFHEFHNSGFVYSNIQRSVNEDHGIGQIPDVAMAMGSWEWQAGFPVVTVSRSGDILTIAQERFMYDKNLQSDNLWWIPLNYATASNPNFTSTRPDFYMANVRNMTIQNNQAPKPWNANDWVIFNIQLTGYFRVNYDQELWQLIINQLNGLHRGFERIHYRNRGQLIDDAHHLARSHRINFNTVFHVMNYLWQELDYFPWVAANHAFNFLNPRLSGSPVYAYFQEFVRHSSEGLFNHLGVQLRAREPRLDRFSRTFAMNQACRAQLPECLQQTNQELSANVFENRRIEPEYRAPIYCHGLRTGSTLLFLAMQNRLLRTIGDQGERNNHIDGMACTQNPELLPIYLNLAITPGVSFTNAEKNRILTAPAVHGENSLIAMMEFIEIKFGFINNEGPNFLPNMLNSISNNIASEKLYGKFMLLMAELLCQRAITDAVFTQHLNQARNHLDWQRENLTPIEQFFIPN